MQYRKKILITGASGFLGRAVAQRLDIEAEVVGVGHRHAHGTMRSVDLRDAQAFRSLLDEVRPDVVIHCAAYRDPDFCEEEQEEAWRLNVHPVRTLTEGLSAHARLVHISTDYVFDGEHPPYDENDKRFPINLYGQSKLEAEDIALGRDSTIILRIPLLVGCGSSFEESGYIAKTIQAIEKHEPMELDDRTMRFPTDIGDVAEVIAFLLNRDAVGVYHYSAVRGQTPYQWTRELADLAGEPKDHILSKREPVFRAALRPVNSQLAVDRIRALGFERVTDFPEVVGRVLALRV